ncbi:hypothetical protein SAMN05661044_01195 [Olivibacter domesticus]|uniref:Uncharacterized protein n=1 Tax=Olivibacter domesticus TaxID=407022 RepID=A0A1H7K2D5_OLID1|nr:hypothetical protein SAMN05661044_01195 [Olivibacter domesticus]
MAIDLLKIKNTKRIRILKQTMSAFNVNFPQLPVNNKTLNYINTVKFKQFSYTEEIKIKD